MTYEILLVMSPWTSCLTRIAELGCELVGLQKLSEQDGWVRKVKNMTVGMYEYLFAVYILESTNLSWKDAVMACTLEEARCRCSVHACDLCCHAVSLDAHSYNCSVKRRVFDRCRNGGETRAAIPSTGFRNSIDRFLKFHRQLLNGKHRGEKSVFEKVKVT